MSFKIRENLGGILASSNRSISTPKIKPNVGKVYGIVTTKDTPTKKQFEKAGGFNGIGTVFYLDYNQSKNTTGSLSDDFLDRCKIAKPFNDSMQAYPLIGELILISSAPSPANQISETTSQKYYMGVVNVWNNNQLNSPSPGNLGKTFIENTDVRRLLAFEGDRIIQGRKGNGIRLGSTVKYHADLNEWSSIGEDGDPITILINGYVTTDTSNNAPNIEEINKEMSSIYMTSTQKIPLLPDRKDILNPITQPRSPESYLGGSQLILNSDRVTLNSKKDEVMIFAKTNVEISTNNIINLNSGLHTHINSPVIFLGTKQSTSFLFNSINSLPDEPVLLGRSTVTLINKLMDILCKLGNNLTSTVSPPPGSPIMEINAVGTSLVNDINIIRKDLEKLLSKTTFTA
jgi:hypothetical protein